MRKRKIIKPVVLFIVCFFIAVRIESRTQTYKVSEPDWNNPRILTYSYLKTIAQKKKNIGRFPDDIVSSMNGAAVELKGAIIPIDGVPRNGEISYFWLVNPRAMMGGCVFCNAPAMHDMVYVETAKGHKPLKIDVEKLYSDVVSVKIKGRFFLGPDSIDGMTYLFRIVRM